jgi:hypothetical protein
MKITGPMVALAALATLVFLAILGSCIWLIDRGFAPPSLVATPIAALLAGIVGAAISAARYYLKLPPAPPGTEYRLFPSLSPGPTDAVLSGQVPFPLQGASVARIPVADSVQGPIEIMHIDEVDPPSVTSPNPKRGITPP